MRERHLPKHHSTTGTSGGRWRARLRRVLAWRARRVTSMTMPAVLVLSGVTAATLLTSSQSPANATAPGTPGTPQAPTAVYTEDFQNRPGPSPIVRLDGYTGASGQAYTADPEWLTFCNGWIASGAEDVAAAAQIADCANGSPNGQSFWNNSQRLAEAVGIFHGQSVAAAADNYADTAYSANNPGAGKTEFQTATNVPLTASDRFIAFSVDVAAVNCAVSAPLLRFYLLDGGGNATAAGSQINACTGGQNVTVPALGVAPAGSVSVGTYNSGAVLFSGNSVGVRMINNNGSGAGNDHTIDNIQVLDVTPQLDKSFSPTSVQVGQSTALTFTITNTSELAAKNGWSFTDTLPAGMSVTGPAATTTCPSGAITAAAGATSVTASGNLSAGMASCTVTVHVTAGSAGDYPNGPSNVTESGLNPPGSSTVTFTVPTIDCSTNANVFNTGYNAATDGVLADGSKDLRWMVAGGFNGFYFPNGTSPATATPLPPAGAAFVPAQVGKVNTLWANSPNGNSQWVSADYVPPSNGQNQAAGSGDWYYQYQFNLDPAVDPTTFALSIKWLSDNSLASLWVNGAQKYVTPNTDPYHQGNLSQSTAVPLTLNSGWQAGLNTVLVQVKSYYVAEGFDAQVQPSSLCPSITVTKQVSGRNDPSDQFTVSVKNSGGTTLTSATTTGTQTNVTSDPASITSGSTYTITDAMAAGSATSINYYGASIACTDTTTGLAAPTSGSGPSWTITTAKPDAYSCVVTNTASGPAWTCSAFGYLFQNPGGVPPTTIFQVDLASGAVSTKATSPNDGLNALGYNTLDNYVYGWDATKSAVVRVAADGTITSLGVPAGMAPADMTANAFNVGDFDSSGHLWIVNGNPSPSTWYEIDLAPGSPTYGQVINHGIMTHPAGVNSVADWTFINGAFYGMSSLGTGNSLLLKFTPGTGLVSLGAVAGVPGADVYGAAYTDAAGDLFVSDNGTGQIYRINVTTAKLTASNPGPASGNNDGARCATAPIPTITVTKQVAGRVQAGDQFTVGLKGPGGATQTSATTATTQTSVSTTNWPVSQNATYTITDAMAAGSPDTLTAYTATVSCTDKAGNAVTTGGTKGAWTMTVANPTDYTCIVTNTPGTKSYTVTKTASTAGPVHPGDTVTYTVVVQNTGPVPYLASSPATVSDNLADVLDDATYNNDATNGATVSGNQLSWSGALAPQGSAGDSVTITYSVTVNNPDAGNSILKNTVVGGTNCPAGSTAPACGTNTLVQSYRVTKTADATQVTPGATIHYTVTVQNTGAVDYTAAAPASFQDDLTSVLDDAVYNNDATSGATYSAPVLSWSGALAVGQTVTITYSVTVDNPDNGDAKLANTIVTPGDGPCPAGSTNPDCGVVIPEQSFSVVKTASTTTAKPGDVVTYTITVTNTGQVDYSAAQPAHFDDSLAGVLDDAVYNNDATNGATYSAPTLSWSGALPVGQTVTITYSVAVDNPDQGDALLRNVVTTPPDGSCATGSTNPGCVNQVPVEQFKTAKSASTSQAKPGDTVTYTVTVTNTGQVAFTAADPAGFTDDLSAVLDDATYNADASASDGSAVAYTAPTLSWSGALGLGATVTITYTVTVDKPDTGDHTLSNAITPIGPGVCSDGSPAPCPPVVTLVPDYTTTKTASSATATPGATITYTLTIKNTGQVDYTADNPATATDDLSGVIDDATYNNDATGGATYAAPVLSWSGALAINQTVVITYSVTVDKPDKGDHTLKNAVVGGQCSKGSTDPACSTTTPIADYTVIKTASVTTAGPGDTVTYTVTITNAGQVAYTAASPATFTDDLSGVLDDAAYNNDATNGAVASLPNLTWSGALAVGATTTVTYSVTVNNPDTGDHHLKNTVTGGSNCPASSTDSACGTDTPVQDYVVAKTVDKASAKPGDTVTYTVTVQNIGSATVASATFSDDLTGVLDDATYNNDASNGATFASPTLSWTGPLAVGQTVTVTYSLTVNQPDAGDHTLTNTVVGGTDCPAGATDLRCSPAPVPVREYTLTKTASATTVHPGDTITYTVSVKNTGAAAYTAADPATFTDNLAGVLDDATYNNDATNAATYAAPVLTWSGALAVGQTITVTYSVTVDNPDAGDGKLPNAVLGGDCTTPTDPGCSADTLVQSYSTVKTADQTKVTPGEKITYTIKVTNTGQVAYSAAAPASYTDDLTNVLDDATYNNDADNGATYSAPVLSWSGALAVGQTITITYSVTVNSPDTGDQKLRNTVVTTGEGGNCPVVMAAAPAARAFAAAVGTAAAAPTAATNPECTALVPGNQLAVKKTASATTAEPGQAITYTVTVTNTGQTDFTAADPATFTDDLSGVLDDATYNNDASNGATVTGATLSWSGPLAIGDTVAVTYSVTINAPDTGDKVMKNVVQLPPGTNSNCSAGSTDPDCATTTPVGTYDVVKRVSATQVKPGDTVTYTVTLTNTGQVPFTAAQPATFTDDMTDVLDDATYNHDATAGATVSGKTLSWSGALPLGATVTVTYSVTVNTPDTGNKKLHNAVTTPVDPGGVIVATCPAGTSDPDCSTNTGVLGVSTVRPAGAGGLAATGNDTRLQLILAGLLIGAGALLAMAGLRRRRTN